MRRTSFFVKRVLDLLAAGILICVLFPLLAALALAILISSGRPILFKQPRVGRNGKKFMIYKFRTMVRGADDLLNPDLTAPAARVTRIGAVLRRYSLDELPQLINIVRGEMSVVGPRATLPEVHARFTPEQQSRTRVRPGVTGLAQVSGRNSIPWSERIRLDNLYIDSYSLGLDAKILAKTVVVWLKGDGFEMDRTEQRIDTNDVGSTEEAQR